MTFLFFFNRFQKRFVVSGRWECRRIRGAAILCGCGGWTAAGWTPISSFGTQLYGRYCLSRPCKLHYRSTMQALIRLLERLLWLYGHACRRTNRHSHHKGRGWGGLHYTWTIAVVFCFLVQIRQRATWATPCAQTHMMPSPEQIQNTNWSSLCNISNLPKTLLFEGMSVFWWSWQWLKWGGVQYVHVQNPKSVCTLLMLIPPSLEQFSRPNFHSLLQLAVRLEHSGRHHWVKRYLTTLPSPRDHKQAGCSLTGSPVVLGKNQCPTRATFSLTNLKRVIFPNKQRSIRSISR